MMLFMLGDRCGADIILVFLLNALEHLSFSGKVVKYFTTHEGSGLGSILEDVKECCHGADIRDGLALRGSDVENSKEIIESWCNK